MKSRGSVSGVYSVSESTMARNAMEEHAVTPLTHRYVPSRAPRCARMSAARSRQRTVHLPVVSLSSGEGSCSTVPARLAIT